MVAISRNSRLMPGYYDELEVRSELSKLAAESEAIKRERTRNQCYQAAAIILFLPGTLLTTWLWPDAPPLFGHIGMTCYSSALLLTVVWSILLQRKSQRLLEKLHALDARHTELFMKRMAQSLEAIE